MKLTIRNKLTGGFALVLVLAVAVGALALLAFNSVGNDTDLTVSSFLEYKDINRQINIAMLQARRSEKDFLMRRDAKYIKRVATAVENIRTLSEAVKGLEINQAELERSEQINNLVNEYHATFLKVVEGIEKKGSGDLGIVGSFRAKVHEVEGIVEEANALQLQVDMLTLRRNEKDYLLRGNEKYVNKIKESVAVFRNHINGANLDESKTALLDASVLEYQDKFLQVVAIDNRIKADTDDFREVIQSIEPLIDENVADATLLATTAVDKLHTNISNSTTLIIISLFVAIAIGVALSFLLSKSITNPINVIVSMIEDVAQGEGDLTKRLDIESKDELGELATWFNTFMGKLHDIISQVKANAIEVSSAATEIASAAEQASAGANEQTAQTGEVATSVEQMTATILESAQNANQATESAQQAGDVATEGGSVVQRTIEGMSAIASSVSESAVTIEKLGKRSDEIGEIIEVIDDIADQTNLLALNAAIEAARAGEQGRGFAVVADEVRKLAERTTKATAEIAGMIKGIQEETGDAVTSMEEASKQVEDGTELTAKAGDSLSQIVSVVAEVQNMIAQIATASDEQSAAAEQISGNVAGISSVSQQTAQGAEQIATASEQLNRQTEALDALVGQFKLAENKTLEKA